MSRVRRKPAFCICENKDADQFHSNREADQRLCFRYMDSMIPLLNKSEISSLYPSSVAVQPGLCGTWSETPKTNFLTTRLIYPLSSVFTSEVFFGSALSGNQKTGALAARFVVFIFKPLKND